MNILIVGEGGQGVQKIGEILAQAAFLKKLKATYIPNFTVEQRGGASLAFVKISQETIIYPKFNKPDWIVVLSRRSINRANSFFNSRASVIYNSSLINKSDFKNLKFKKILDLPAGELANKINPRSFNMIMLGKIVRESNLFSLAEIKKETAKIFYSKYILNPNLEQQNNEALRIGFN